MDGLVDAAASLFCIRVSFLRLIELITNNYNGKDEKGKGWLRRGKYDIIVGVMKILAIESSCDETAAAVVEDGAKILSNVVVSQVDIFAVYGGVIPEVAARSHLEAILPVVEKALADAGATKEEIDAIAVTHTPGLLGSLLIGTLTARMLAILWGKPLYAVHHLKSHIYANWLSNPVKQPSSPSREPLDSPSSRVSRSARRASTRSYSLSEDDGSFADSAQSVGMNPEFPLLALVISGGHTQIIYMREHNQFEIIGTTRDDAVGECFDKVAKILGLPYPGGPSIDKCAAGGKMGVYRLPHPKVEGLDFSFSGLKTAVLRAVQAELRVPITTPSFELAEKLTEQQRADFAAAFQDTACEILLEKLEMALEAHPEAKSLVFAGGVSANKVLKERALERLQKGSDGVLRRVYFPELKFCGDNAAMVGAAAYYEIMTGVQPTDPYKLNIAPRTVIS